MVFSSSSPTTAPVRKTAPRRRALAQHQGGRSNVLSQKMRLVQLRTCGDAVAYHEQVQALLGGVAFDLLLVHGGK